MRNAAQRRSLSGLLIALSCLYASLAACNRKPIATEKLSHQEVEAVATSRDRARQDRHSKVWLTEQERKAVEVAESFIAENGYTDRPANRENITFESIEEGELDDILRSRHGTLKTRAYGLRANHEGEWDWMVFFEYAEGRSVGRVVTMNSDYRNLRVQHQDADLDAVDKKL